MHIPVLLLLAGCDLVDDIIKGGDDTGDEVDPMVRVDAACASDFCDYLLLTATNDYSDAVTYNWISAEGWEFTGDTVEVEVDTENPTLDFTLQVDWDDGLEAELAVEGAYDPVEPTDTRAVIDAIWLFTGALDGRCRFYHQAVAIDGADGLSGCISGSTVAQFEYSTTGTPACGATVTTGLPCFTVSKAPDSTTPSAVSLGQTGSGAVFRNVTSSGYFNGSQSATFGMDIFLTGGSGWVHHTKYDGSGAPVPSNTTNYYPHRLTCPTAPRE